MVGVVLYDGVWSGGVVVWWCALMVCGVVCGGVVWWGVGW